MRYTLERLPDSRVAVDVELEEQQVEKALDRAARRISRRTRVPGFRPGKAPRDIIEARYGRAVLYEEASNDLVQRAYKEILAEADLEPVAEASLEDMTLEPFHFRLVVPVRPTVTLGDYYALRFGREVSEVTDEDVQAVLERLQDEQTVWIQPGEARPAVLGDRLLVNLVGTVGEREIEHSDDAEIELGAEGLPPGFSERLVGAEVGQTLEIEVVLPEQPESELAGQTAHYTVTVLGIKEAEIPTLSDDFARSFGQEQTLEEMKARLRDELAAARHKRAQEQQLEQMIQAVVEQAQVDMPEVLVEQEADSMYQSQEAELKKSQISMEQFLGYLGREEEQYRQELLEQARPRMRRSLVLRELVRAEAISVEEQDFPVAIERIMDEQGGLAEEKRQELRELLSQPRMRPDLEANILSHKLEQTLLAIAGGQVAGDSAPEGAESPPAAETAADQVQEAEPGEIEPQEDPDELKEEQDS
ncbi:MAG: trigger factor [Chloroflexia bacterium]|nr:trigger factor [Chloroflexia bacterium]